MAAFTTYLTILTIFVKFHNTSLRPLADFFILFSCRLEEMFYGMLFAGFFSFKHAFRYAIVKYLRQNSCLELPEKIILFMIDQKTVLY